MKFKHSLRSPLGRVRGLGSAKHGTEGWWLMRLTSIALVPLCIWFLTSLLMCIQVGDYNAVRAWVASPVAATLLILLLLAGFHHAVNGIKEVIEDYIHCEAMKIASLIAVKFFGVICALAGVLAVLKILFGG